MSLQMIGDCLLIAVAIVVMGWILVYFTGSMLSQTTAGKDAVKVVDTTAEVAAYTGLTAIRYMPAVQADPNAVASCEYLLTAVMKWPSTTAGAAATGSSASKS